jgi:hypothetical protein
MLLRTPLVLALALSLVVGAPSLSQTRSGPVAANAPLTVVELFTSQGCSSCPPANANLGVLARRSDVLALSYGVNYWDYLGWRDTFARQAFTDRQRDYARGLALRNVYTPQMVVNGRVDSVGNRMSELNGVLQRAPRIGPGPSIIASASGVTLSGTASTVSPATIWLVRYDPRVVQVPIRGGENGGKTLPHVNVVREFSQLGHYNGRAITVRLTPATDPALKTAILLQSGAGGPLIAAAKL